MVIRRPLPELRVEIVCDGKTVQVLDGYGQVIEEREVDAQTYIEVSGEVSKMEAKLIKVASAMEIGR